MPIANRRAMSAPRLCLVVALGAAIGLAGCQQNGMGGGGMGGEGGGEFSPIAGTLGGAGLGALAGRLIAGSHGNSAAMLGGALIGGLGGLLGTTVYNRDKQQENQLSYTRAQLAQQEQINQQLHAQQLYDGWAQGREGMPPQTVNAPGDVRAAQGLLAGLGFYYGTVDGHYGPATRSAVLAFQNAHNLPANGEVTPGLVQQLRGAI